MSGVAATAGGDPAAGARWLGDAAALLAGRGPDAQAARHDGRAGLAHALLRTLPEDAFSRQPLSLGSDDVWIAADARLDDRAGLERALRAAGRAVGDGRPDAELVLHAWHAWGERCVDHLAGDFAFALWDGATSTLFCAHDQFGVVPLYYTVVDGRFMASNSLDALLVDPAVSDALDEGAVADFLLLDMNARPEATTFAAIRRLPPAHALTWRAGTLTTREYWRAPEPPDEYLRLPDEAEYVERFRALLAAAVDDRRRGAPSSVQLSGGLDSTSVAALAARSTDAPFRAITVVGERGAGDEEGAFAAMVAAVCGIADERLVVGDYPDLDPFAPPAFRTAEPQPYVRTGLEADFAARTVAAGRVAFSGQGGDALLMFLPTWWMDALGRGEVGRLARVWREHRRVMGARPPIFLRPALRHRRSLGAPVVVPALDWLDPDFARRTGAADRAREIRLASRVQLDHRWMSRAPTWANLFAAMDPGFAGIPVRYRHPFFDTRLVAFVSTLAPVPWLPRKRILREAMRGILPEPVRVRPKAPLGHDPRRRMAVERGPVAGALDLVAETAQLSHIVRRERLVTDDASGMARYGPLASTLSLAHWLHHWRRPSRPAGRDPVPLSPTHQETDR